MTERTLPTILKVETVAKSRIFEVQAVDLRFSNGEERTFERLTPQRGSSVLILPIHQNEMRVNRQKWQQIVSCKKKLVLVRKSYIFYAHFILRQAICMV
mgnify:CR=1 FL=1